MGCQENKTTTKTGFLMKDLSNLSSFKTLSLWERTEDRAGERQDVTTQASKI